MITQMQSDDFSGDGVNLLVSLLVRYPEIATLAFDPRKNSITLKFMFLQPTDAVQWTPQRLSESLAAYHELVRIQPAVNELRMSNEGQLAMLTLERDVTTISKGEILLLIGVLREQIKALLVADPVEAPPEDSGFQEELIENMLTSIKSNYGGQGLIGIREEGRVLVFNK